MTAMIQTTSTIVENVQLAERTFRVRLHCPELARRIQPGQFVMVRPATGSDPLLGRPLALYDTVLDEDGHETGIDIVYLVVGKMTGLLATMSPDTPLDIWGPLGNGFPDLTSKEHVALVAGGIGQTPFLAHIRSLLGTRSYRGQPRARQADRVSIYYGVRTKSLAAGVEDFQAAGAEVHLASDDGSIGHHGFVTDLLREHSAPDQIVACGPEPMLHAVADQAKERNIPCLVSLETPMACGVGICFSCVTPVLTEEGWDYKRVCVDGPVFDACELAWNEMNS